MVLELWERGAVTLRLGPHSVRIHFRRPSPGEVIETLVKKIPRGDEAEDAARILAANYELGLSCITGVREGDIMFEGRPLITDPAQAGFREDWKQILEQHCPLLLVALGQHLSSPPAFMEGEELKKASPAAGPSSPAAAPPAESAKSGEANTRNGPAQTARSR